MTDWDDYRYFLAVAEAGSLSAAAKRLRASQPTVGRRIALLEERLDVRLFERRPRGYSLTPAGEAILDLARRLDSNVRDIGLRIKGQDTRFVGTVSISTPESMANFWLIPRLSRLRRLHPGIRIEIHSAAAIADIARGEADLALRFDRPGDDDVLLARKVGRARFGLYATAHYLQRHGTPLALEDLNRHAVIGPAGRLVDTRMTEWLRDVANSEAMACNSMLGIAAAVEAGLGIGILPHYMASPERKLQRLSPGNFETVLDVWLLVHPHTRGAAKMQAVIDFLVRELSADPMLSGLRQRRSDVNRRSTRSAGRTRHGGGIRDRAASPRPASAALPGIDARRGRPHIPPAFARPARTVPGAARTTPDRRRAAVAQG